MAFVCNISYVKMRMEVKIFTYTYIYIYIVLSSILSGVRNQVIAPLEHVAFNIGFVYGF